MAKRNALIFSKNGAIAKIALAELSMLGYSAKIIQEVPSLKDVDAIVFDASTLELSPSIRSYISSLPNAKIIAIVENHSERLSARFDSILTFPFLLSDFRDSLLSPNEKQSTDNKKSLTLSKSFIADNDKKGVSFDEVFISLSEYEFDLLKLLCDKAGSTVSREEILNLFDASDSNIAEVYICHLRNKLEVPFGIKVIYTVRGKGYTTDYRME